MVDKLILTEAQVSEELAISKKPDFDKNTLSKQVHLKHTKLDFTLLAYLRAHLLISYDQELQANSKVTEPSDIDYELYVLEHYRMCLEKVRSHKNLPSAEAVSNEPLDTVSTEFRRKMIRTFRTEQAKLLERQFSIVQSVKKVL